jgi:hypothetical protein
MLGHIFMPLSCTYCCKQSLADCVHYSLWAPRHTSPSVTIHDSVKKTCLIKWLGAKKKIITKIITAVTTLSFNKGCSYKIQNSIRHLKDMVIGQTAIYPFNMLCFKCVCICVKGQLKLVCPICVYTHITNLEALKRFSWKVILGNFMKKMSRPFYFY